MKEKWTHPPPPTPTYSSHAACARDGTLKFAPNQAMPPPGHILITTRCTFLEIRCWNPQIPCLNLGKKNGQIRGSC